MGFFTFLKPAEFAPPIIDQETIRKKYRYWRMRTFYGMYLGYVFYYFSRKSFTFVMPAMAVSLGFDKVQLGMLTSIFSVTYGLSKFVSGIFSDRSNPRYIMGIGLTLTGVFNILFGLSNIFVMFALFWGLNGFFQGWGWPPCAKLLTHWYSQTERGRWWSIWNTSHNLGGALIPILGSIIATYFGWRHAMYIPGISCILVGLFVINRLRDTPQSLGLPPIEVYRNDLLEKGHADSEKLALSTKTILVDYVLKNKYVWILSISYFFVYVIRQAINDWTALYLVETKGYSIIAASSTLFWFEIGGFLGSLAAGWFSDYFFGSKRNPINFLFTLFVTVALLALWKSSKPGLIFDSMYLFVIGFFIFGPQMLIGVACAELSHKKAAGTATGFAGWFAYLGAASAGVPLGMVIKSWGWEGFFVVLAASGIITLLLLLPLWRVKVNPTHIEN